ncbi:ras gtpase [Anaeramoeba ignava]|uniref:Ras gtpase n=1 Tax=Anaeramoeba ignava TaxID=1746090 RepID=A0A9Q0LKS0_ANAIG|nr:ras gtpase [Anaeramoeba ignava]
MDKIIIISIIGNGGVGKSTFTTQFCYSKFIQYYDPTIEESFRKQIVIDDEILIIEILDYYYDSEWNYNFQQENYEKSHGFIVVYSINDKNSFNELENYLNKIYKYKKHGCPFYETSAKTRNNIDETFFTLLREIRKYPFDLELNPKSNSNSNSNSNSKSNCLIF